MKKYILFLLLISSCHLPKPRIQTRVLEVGIEVLEVEIEVLINDSGEFVIEKTRKQSDYVWAQMLLRKTSGLAGVPMVDSLFNKYFYRVVIFESGKRDTVPPAGINFREHREISGIKRAFDLRKSRDFMRDNTSQVLAEINASIIFDALPDDETEDIKIHKRWPLGSLERKEFNMLLFTNFPIAKLDSIRGDSVKWFIADSFFKDSLIVLGLGQSFNETTIGQLTGSQNIPAKLKGFFLQSVLDAPKITAATTLYELLSDSTINQINSRAWLRHSLMRDKLKPSWIKRQQ